MGDDAADLKKLQADKLRSEIEKNKADADKAANEAALVKRQFEDRWYSKRNLKLIAGGVATTVALWGGFQTIIAPLVNIKEDTREWKIKKTEAENEYYAAEFRNIKKERDELVSLRVLLSTDRTLLLAGNDSLKATIQNNIESTRRLQGKFSNLSAQYTKLSEAQDITTAEKLRLERLASQATAENDNLKKQVTRLTADKAGVERSSREINKIAPPVYISEKQATAMLVEKGFYDKNKNPNGTGITHQYEPQTINSNKVVIDHAMRKSPWQMLGYTWQQSGSKAEVNFGQGQKYIQELNDQRYANYNDWRLPTLEEAMSLMEPTQENGDLYIDPLFDQAQRWIWTSDKIDVSNPWVVDSAAGDCSGFHVRRRFYVRAVRHDPRPWDY